MPGEARIVTALTQRYLGFFRFIPVLVARLHFAAASEQRDGVAFLDGHLDRLSTPENGVRVERDHWTAVEVFRRTVAETPPPRGMMTFDSDPTPEHR
jgi:hypothetical protein